jgi:hypothetical protein
LQRNPTDFRLAGTHQQADDDADMRYHVKHCPTVAAHFEGAASFWSTRKTARHVKKSRSSKAREACMLYKKSSGLAGYIEKCMHIVSWQVWC